MTYPRVKKVMCWEDVKSNFIEHQEWSLKNLFERLEKYTPIERIAFVVLHDFVNQFGWNNVRLMPQKKIGKYTVDFEIMYQPLGEESPNKKVIIECDGHEFHEKTKEQASKDKERDRYFSKQGYFVLRYSGSELVRDRFKIYRDLEELLLPENEKVNFGYTPSSKG